MVTITLSPDCLNGNLRCVGMKCKEAERPCTPVPSPWSITLLHICWRNTTQVENWLVWAFLGFWRMRPSLSLSPTFASWRQIPISDNVGGVKHFSSTLTHALRRARHFALVEGLAFCSTNQGPLVIVSGQETRSDPSISSVTTSIMITTSNSPLQGSGTPNRYDGELLHTMGISGLSRVRTELFHLLVIPFLTHHPVHLNRQPASHGDLGDLPSPPHRQVKILAAPLLVTAYRHLRRFYEQE